MISNQRLFLLLWETPLKLGNWRPRPLPTTINSISAAKQKTGSAKPIVGQGWLGTILIMSFTEVRAEACLPILVKRTAATIMYEAFGHRRYFQAGLTITSDYQKPCLIWPISHTNAACTITIPILPKKDCCLILNKTLEASHGQSPRKWILTGTTLSTSSFG